MNCWVSFPSDGGEMFPAQFLVCRDHRVHCRLLNLLNPLPPLGLGPCFQLTQLPATSIPRLTWLAWLAWLVAVNIGQVTVLEVLEVVPAVTGLEVSASSPGVWASHETQAQPGNFPLEGDGQQVLLSSLSLLLLLSPSVLKVGLALDPLVLLLTAIFSLLQYKSHIRAPLLVVRGVRCEV